MDLADRVGQVEERQQARRMPGRAGGQLLALDQDDIGPALLGQVVERRDADHAAADDDRAGVALHAGELLEKGPLVWATFMPSRKPPCCLFATFSKTASDGKGQGGAGAPLTLRKGLGDRVTTELTARAGCSAPIQRQERKTDAPRRLTQRRPEDP